MRRSVALAAALLLVAALVTVAYGADRGKPPPYDFYVACGLSANAKPAHRCARGAKKAAFFRSKSVDVYYKVCVRFPNGLRLCAARQFAKAGKLRRNPITSTKLGAHKVTWYVKGHRVGTRYLRVHR